MKKMAVVCLCVVSVAAWGQRRERHAPANGSMSRDRVETSSRQALKSRKQARSAAADKEASIPQAPGVVQIGPDRTAYFTFTDFTPKGSTVDAAIQFSNSNFLDLGLVTLNRDYQPGDYFALPKICDVGDLWPSGVTTLDVQVTVNGTVTHSAGEFVSGAARTYGDLYVPSALTPLITSWSESIFNRQVILTINGSFTSSPATVVVEDLVVPRSAITQSADGSTINVNLSQVPGSRLDIQQDFLLTVGQDGYTDSRIFTHVPFDPANYDASPSK